MFKKFSANIALLWKIHGEQKKCKKNWKQVIHPKNLIKPNWKASLKASLLKRERANYWIGSHLKMKEVKEQEYKRTEVRIGIGEVQQKMKMKMKNKFKTKEQGEENSY